MTSISRRELLKRVGSAGAVAAGLEAAGLKPRATLVGRASTDVAESAEAAQGASSAIVIAGQPVTIGITPASPLTARITLARPAAARQRFDRMDHWSSGHGLRRPR